ncbi:lysosomal proton-coupled steroid conjugate and bile acid symporter SLC46A3-like [Haliotis asinina]|uniref:lysosomal proton-coupled steroid conjugate and bile acid symporter SLC46A3-like n=1 Tax=Haliotis asinina TaxID=109174 RepID=UPI003531F5FF
MEASRNISKENKKGRTIFGGVMVSVILTLYTCAAMAAVPLQSQYVRHRLLQEYTNTSNASDIFVSSCDNDTVQDMDILQKVQEDTARRLLYFSLSGSIPSILVNLVFGSYSDFLGRKILFFLPLCGDLIKNILTSLVMRYNWSLKLFYAGSVVAGFCGSFTTILLACFSYTADITPPQKSRTIAIAVLETILAVASSAGSLVTGYLISSLGYFYPSLVVVILHGVDVLIVVFLLPETLKNVENIIISPIVHLKKSFGFYTIYGSTLKRVQYNVCIVILFFGVISLIGRTSIETLYQLDLPFCWNSVKIGYYGALRIVIQSVCSVLAIKVLQPCLRDEIIAIVGMLFGAASLAMEAFATTDWMMYIVPVVGICAYTTVPIFRAIMSRMTSPKEQGALFSSIAAMETVCSTASITLYNTVYELTVGTMKGAVFLMMSGFCGLTVLLILMFMVISRGSPSCYEYLIPEEDDVHTGARALHHDHYDNEED